VPKKGRLTDWERIPNGIVSRSSKTGRKVRKNSQSSLSSIFDQQTKKSVKLFKHFLKKE
jgi:hypothetical protein